MSDELRINLDPFKYGGLTLLAKVYDSSGTQQGSDVSMTENATGVYTGDFTISSLTDGSYMISFQTASAFYGYGTLYVRSSAEVSQEQFEKKSEADVRQSALITEIDANETKLDTIQERTDNLPDLPASRQDIIVGYNS